ncbi:MAG: hypothetical protein KBF60_09730 [Ignavibacteriaceae bacterium]|nr:hypothetical protein [Ignavibacteriaceae bacterium]
MDQQMIFGETTSTNFKKQFELTFEAFVKNMAVDKLVDSNNKKEQN